MLTNYVEVFIYLWLNLWTSSFGRFLKKEEIYFKVKLQILEFLVRDSLFLAMKSWNSRETPTGG